MTETEVLKKIYGKEYYSLQTMMSQEDAKKIITNVYEDHEARSIIESLMNDSKKIVELTFISMMERFKKDSVNKLEPKLWKLKPIEIVYVLSGILFDAPKQRSKKIKNEKISKKQIKEVIKYFKQMQKGKNSQTLGEIVDYIYSEMNNKD